MSICPPKRNRNPSCLPIFQPETTRVMSDVFGSHNEGRLLGWLNSKLRYSSCTSKLALGGHQRCQCQYTLRHWFIRTLLASAADFAVDTELRSLRTRLDSSLNLMKRLKDLVNVTNIVRDCEAALGDLFEHIDIIAYRKLNTYVLPMCQPMPFSRSFSGHFPTS